MNQRSRYLRHCKPRAVNSRPTAAWLGRVAD